MLTCSRTPAFLTFFLRLSLFLSISNALSPNRSSEPVCMWLNILGRDKNGWSHCDCLKTRNSHTDFCFLKQNSFYVQSLCVMASGEKSIPTSHSVQGERQSTCRTIKLTAQIYVGQNTSPSLWQVCSLPWACLVPEAVRRTRQMAEQGNHRVTIELLSIADSYVTLEWPDALLREAHQIIYRACHPAQIMSKLPFELRQNKIKTEICG